MVTSVTTGTEQCNQIDCGKPGAFTFTWPGRDEAAICEDHVGHVRGVAQAMGMHLEVKRIRPGRAAQLGFAELRLANVTRCEKAFHLLDAWSPADWMLACTGELGEAANLIKKVKRGDFELDEKRSEIGEELADVVIYLDLLAANLGIDLGEATRRKFNIVSERRGSDIKL